MRRIGSDLLLIFLILLLAVGFYSYLERFFGAYQENVEIDLSIWRLPQYTFFSLARGFFAFILSFIFSLSWGFWAAKDRTAEKVLIPLLDLLQSIPILGFLPGVVLLLVSLFQHSNIGLELAAILLMFTGQVWNMVFGVYHGIRTVPIEKTECATAFGFSSFQKFRWVELPCSALSLIWNSIMSVAGGWFFLMINEAFTLGKRDFRLPGVGSYMSVAAERGDIFAMILGIIAMFSLIIFLDQLVWRPLVAWSQKFRIEETSPILVGTSWFLTILRESLLISSLRSYCHKLEEILQNRRSKKMHGKINVASIGLILSWFFLLCFLIVITLAIVYTIELVKVIKLEEWVHLSKLLSFTFSRVYSSVFISILIMVPLGLLVGLSEKLTQRLQPFLQIGASFPASLLFPIAVLFFHWLKIPLGIGSIALMLLGTQWYVFFNVMAGARAMPTDLREVAHSFNYNRLQRFIWLYLPAVFPYLITGILSAAGGAWNASIVAEYIDYNQQVLTTPGIGSMISLAAQNNNFPLLAASILLMMTTVVLINYLVWLRLYHYSEKRYALNA